MLKGVILIGGPQKGTRFRPLSFELPKPLFPVAGYPIIYHHIYALSTIEDVKEIYLIGFFQPSEDLNRFILNAQNEFKIPIRYLQEYRSLGTGGGMLFSLGISADLSMLKIVIFILRYLPFS
jgi:mannose-1-phosphate guanylyltransferase